MKRTALTVAFVVFSSAFIVTIVVLPEARATTLYVGGGGPGNYTTIQGAIDDASPGDTVYVYSGTYIENVTVYKSLSLVGEDKNTTTIQGDDIDWTVNVTADGVSLTNLTVSGGGHGRFDAGIQLYYANNCHIAHNNVSSNPEVGIYLFASSGNMVEANVAWNSHQGIYLRDSNDNTIVDNNISGGSGFILVDSSNNSLLRNVALDSYRSIHLHGSHDNVISNNTMRPDMHEGVYVKESNGNRILDNAFRSKRRPSVYLDSSNNATLANNAMGDNGIYISGDSLGQWNTHAIDESNTLNGNPVYYWKNRNGGTVPSGAGQVLLANCTNVTVENQNVSKSYVGIELGFSSQNVVANNTASYNFLGSGIVIWHSTYNTIANNTARWNYDHGIVLVDSHHNTLTENVALEFNDVGITLQDSDYNIIKNNSLSGNEWFGIYFHSSHNNTIGNNTLTGGGSGLSFNDGGNNTIFHNNITLNWRGISLSGSDSNMIVDNIIAENSEGIDVFSGTNNSIFHNNIVSNSRQAYDSGIDNQWDDGYPSGGNYWSDYNGTDNKWGPNQDFPGPDGIGDTPYVIDADSQDTYPLMTPYEPSTRPPTVYDAILSGRGLENVTLKWSLSPDDGGGLHSVVAYEIYRNMTYHPGGIGYQLIASLPNQTAQYIDNWVGEGDQNSYFYRICALDRVNMTVCAEDQAAKFTRPLLQGPNLVSIPLIQSNESIETVLQTLEYDKAWFYGSSSQEWKWYMKSKTYRRGLWSVNHTMGVWVNVTWNSNLTVAGVVPAQTTIHMFEGWNLVSIPSFNSSYTVADLKAEIGATRVEGYDPTPPYFLRVLGDAEVLQAGYAYWVRVEADVDWTVKVS